MMSLISKKLICSFFTFFLMLSSNYVKATTPEASLNNNDMGFLLDDNNTMRLTIPSLEDDITIYTNPDAKQRKFYYTPFLLIDWNDFKKQIDNIEKNKGSIKHNLILKIKMHDERVNKEILSAITETLTEDERKKYKRKHRGCALYFLSDNSRNGW